MSSAARLPCTREREGQRRARRGIAPDGPPAGLLLLAHPHPASAEPGALHGGPHQPCLSPAPLLVGPLPPCLSSACSRSAPSPTLATLAAARDGSEGLYDCADAPLHEGATEGHLQLVPLDVSGRDGAARRCEGFRRRSTRLPSSFFNVIGLTDWLVTQNIARIVVNKHFQQLFGLSTLSASALADAKGWITAIATAGAVFGCLGGGSHNVLPSFARLPTNARASVVFITDRIGRLNALRVSSVFYLAGILGQACSNGNLSGMYASRFIGGCGIGGTTVRSCS